MITTVRHHPRRRRLNAECHSLHVDLAGHRAAVQLQSCRVIRGVRCIRNIVEKRHLRKVAILVNCVLGGEQHSGIGPLEIDDLGSVRSAKGFSDDHG